MKYLKELHADVTRKFHWVHTNDTKTAVVGDDDAPTHSLNFTLCEDSNWSVTLLDTEDKYLYTNSSIFNAFSQMHEHLDEVNINILTNEDCNNHTLQVIKSVQSIYDYNVNVIVENNIIMYTLSKSPLSEGVEVLTEEPNTSLMYHKLFPNKRLLRDLESRGYTFQMGSGLKIYKKFYASTHRGSGPSKRRTLQSVVILKDGKLFRKIPKSKWVQLTDVSDKDSVSWGTVFMKQMLARETELHNERRDKLIQKKKDRLTASSS